MSSKIQQIICCAALLSAAALFQSAAIAQEGDIYMGAPVTLEKAANGAIANKKLLDRVEEAARLINLFDRYLPQEAVVIPPATLVQDHQ